ncbi:hypothetical protein [Streptomyces halobius]|uniref:ABM domain-containing protein n=1 Tax=Streptomyces halobius TaxID=2879846 RepID=A0ABY4LZ08_9ACTN|nr:hypothetical protein [Streptomyces halobius]UQA90732.1 hypothetical protein K9S39_01465 [Streptomyces halobius]
MMDEQANKVLELVVFKLKAGVTPEQLLGAVDAVSEWAGRQPGFVSRDLSYSSKDDKWIDVVWWRSLKDAQSAAHAAETSTECAPMFGLIDHESMLMLHGEPATAPASH